MKSKGGALHPNKILKENGARHLNRPPFHAWRPGTESGVQAPPGSRIDPRGFTDEPVPLVPADLSVAQNQAQHTPDDDIAGETSGTTIESSVQHEELRLSTPRLSSASIESQTRQPVSTTAQLASVAEHTWSADALKVMEKMARNLAAAAGREGTHTFLTTWLREYVGHAATQGLRDTPESVKIALSGVILGTTALLNVLVFLEQRRSGRANRWTRTGQLSNIAWISGGAAVAGATGGLGDAFPLLAKATLYSVSRDVLNLFVRLGDNRDSNRTTPSRNTVLMESVIYGINQFVVNTLQGSGISKSGTSAAAESLSIRQAAPAITAFSLANAFGETMDAVCYPALTAFFDKFDTAPTWLSGVKDGMRAISELELTARLHVPFGQGSVAGVPIGNVSKEDVADKAMGAMLGRNSLFVALFALVGAISQVGPAAKLDPTNAARVTNVLVALAIALMVPAFVGTASASPRRQTGERDIEVGDVDR
ncbi:hypothetical protein C6P77_23630 [Burkholderia ambifaria]|nr:hypothetical protein C6P77_23630 [Burkholderia ambifaria]